MGSEQKSQSKLSTQELFGDILGEVEAAWESHGRRATGAAAREQPSKSASNGSPGRNPVSEPDESETAELSDPSALEQAASGEPSAVPLSTSEPRQELPTNGHPGGSAPLQEPWPEPDPQLDEAQAAREPDLEAEAASEQDAPRSEEVRLSSPPSPKPDGAQPSPSTPDIASLLESDETDDEADAVTEDPQERTDDVPVEDLVGYLPWLEERRTTDWARLAAMAAVVAVAGAAIWWFALRPADAGADAGQASVTAAEPLEQQGESFIAELEQDAQAEGEVLEVVTAQDQVTAVVEASPQPQPTAAQPAAQTQPQQAGPSVAELEAMIAGQLAAQERRLRQQLEEQRRLLEDEIARLEAANASQAQAPPAEGEPAADQTAAEAETAAAGDEPTAESATGAAAE